MHSILNNCEIEINNELITFSSIYLIEKYKYDKIDLKDIVGILNNNCQILNISNKNSCNIISIRDNKKNINIEHYYDEITFYNKKEYYKTLSIKTIIIKNCDELKILSNLYCDVDNFIDFLPEEIHIFNCANIDIYSIIKILDYLYLTIDFDKIPTIYVDHKQIFSSYNKFIHMINLKNKEIDKLTKELIDIKKNNY